MGSIAPPDGWKILTGTWGTDLDRDETTLFSGIASIKFKNTSVATSVLSPPFYNFNLNAGSALYEPTIPTVWMYVKGDGVSNVSHTITVQLLLYGADGTLNNTITIYNSNAAPNSSFWNIISYQLTHDDTTTNAFGRLKITKSAQAFSFWLNSVFAQHAPPYADHAMLGGATSPTLSDTVGSWETLDIQPNGDSYVIEMDRDTADGKFIVPIGGVYSVSAHIRLDADPDTDSFDIRIAHTRIADGLTDYYYGTPAIDKQRVASLHVTFLCKAGETLELQYKSDVDRTLEDSGTVLDKWSQFSAVRIGR